MSGIRFNPYFIRLCITTISFDSEDTREYMFQSLFY